MKKAILHPLLFAIFPVVSLYFHNQGQPVPPEAVMRGLVLAALLAAVFWGLAFLALRDGSRAAWIASLAAILFLSYGHFAVAGGEFFRRLLDLHVTKLSPAILVPWLVVLVGGIAVISRAPWRFESGNSFGNAVAASLIAVSLVGGVMASGSSGPVPLTDVDVDAPVVEDPERLPDIYYIVLDEYPNTDILREMYGYDNSWFIEDLEARGFAVPEHTRANYAHTFLSLASTLNMRHLTDLTEILGEDSPDPSVPYAMVDENAVMQLLGDTGYDIVHFDSGWVVTEHISQADETRRCGTISEFERTLIANTIFNLFFDDITRADMRDRVDCQFTELGRMPGTLAGSEAPTFTFAHIISPHPPYVFGPNGEDVNPYPLIEEAEDPHAMEVQLYLDQTTYVSKRVLTVVDRILEESETPPVIIIQSDHGSNRLSGMEDREEEFMNDRFRNFNAILLPGQEDAVPEAMTNVNTFPIVLNALLGTDLEMQVDDAYYSTSFEPYRFRNVTDIVDDE